jgi:hypothetical protein
MSTAVVPPTCRNGHALTADVVVYWGSPRPQCRTCQNLASLAYHRRLREEAIHHYGGACACCGETELAFLAIDHIEGGGRAHRQAIGWGGSNLYGWLHRMGYPTGFRCLCHNCNVARGMYGICPHTELRRPAGAPSAGERAREVTRLAGELRGLLTAGPIADLPARARRELQSLYRQLALLATD